MKQQAILQGLIHSTPDGVAIFDTNHRMIFVNQQYCAMWKETAERLQAMTRQDLYNLKLAKLTNPERDAHLLHVRHAQNTMHEKAHFKLKDARWFERLVYEHQVDGRAFGYVIQWRDVTASFGELSTANHERDQMHAIMEGMSDQVFFKDLNSRFIRVNTSMARSLGLNDPA